MVELTLWGEKFDPLRIKVRDYENVLRVEVTSKTIGDLKSPIVQDCFEHRIVNKFKTRENGKEMVNIQH